MNRNEYGAKGHPYLTDLVIEKLLPSSPPTRNRLDVELYNAKTTVT